MLGRNKKVGELTNWLIWTQVSICLDLFVSLKYLLYGQFLLTLSSAVNETATEKALNLFTAHLDVELEANLMVCRHGYCQLVSRILLLSRLY